MKTLIVGFGEVGQGLLGNLTNAYTCAFKDKEDIECKWVDWMHICFPYSSWFVKEVKRLKRKYKPKYTVIHSTVPVGTTKKCADYFSPIVGKHPHLEESIRTFKKWIAGKDLDKLEKYYAKAGIKTMKFSSTDSLEFAKVMCTSRYWVDICFMKMMKFICDNRRYNFDEVYTMRTNNYNEWYAKMGDKQFWRPVLSPMPGKIWGHCVIPNLKFEKNPFTNFVELMNEIY